MSMLRHRHLIVSEPSPEKDALVIGHFSELPSSVQIRIINGPVFFALSQRRCIFMLKSHDMTYKRKMSVFLSSPLDVSGIGRLRNFSEHFLAHFDFILEQFGSPPNKPDTWRYTRNSTGPWHIHIAGGPTRMHSGVVHARGLCAS